jgi:hypothetical protein
MSNINFLPPHEFYAKIFYYLRGCFPNITDEQISKISESGYYYFKYLLELDYIIDNSNIDKLEKIEAFKNLLLYQNKSLEILKLLFSNNMKFWKLFSIHNKIFFETLKFESQLSMNMNYNDFNWFTFKKVSIGKSILKNLKKGSNLPNGRLNVRLKPTQKPEQRFLLKFVSHGEINSELLFTGVNKFTPINKYDREDLWIR